jgi:hypothetical protein
MKLDVIVTNHHDHRGKDAGQCGLPCFPDAGVMSRKFSLLSLLLLLILPCAVFADEKAARCLKVAEEERQRAQALDMRPDAKCQDAHRRLKQLWRQLPRKERDALRQQMRANWERLSPEHRQKLYQAYRRGHRERQENREKREESRNESAHQKEEHRQLREARRKAHEAHWQSLTPEEREALRDTIRHWQHEETEKIITDALPEDVAPDPVNTAAAAEEPETAD